MFFVAEEISFPILNPLGPSHFLHRWHPHSFLEHSRGFCCILASEASIEPLHRMYIYIFPCTYPIIQVVVSNIFYFYPYLRKWSNFTHIFQMGWFNHHLEYIHTHISCISIRQQTKKRNNTSPPPLQFYSQKKNTTGSTPGGGDVFFPNGFPGVRTINASRSWKKFGNFGSRTRTPTGWKRG